jgi:glycogen synthase
MKILVISNLYPPHQLGGYEIGCRNIVNGLRSRGHEVHVLTSPSHFEQIDTEDSIYRSLQLRAFQFGGSESAQTKLEAQVSNYTNTSVTLAHIASFRPDCVYLFNLYGLGGLGIVDALNTLKYPWIMHLMDQLPHMLQHGVHRSVLELFNAANGNIYRPGKLISMSAHLMREIQRSCGFNYAMDADLVPGWADVEGPIRDREYCRNGHAEFVTAGAIQPHKGIDLIVKAVALLKEEMITNFKVTIYGNGKQAFYIDLCKQLQVTDKISFKAMQTQADLIESYRASDAFLFPTWAREPFGFAPIEAAAVGCVPVITHNCGAAERLIRNVHCLKIERTATSLRDAMRSICSGLAPLADLGKNAQAITRQDLSFSHCIGRIENILSTAIYKSAPPGKPDWLLNNLCYLKHNLSARLSN